MNKKQIKSSLRSTVDAEAISYPINRLPRKHKCSLAMTENQTTPTAFGSHPSTGGELNRMGKVPLPWRGAVQCTAGWSIIAIILAFLFSVNANAQTSVTNEAQLRTAITSATGSSVTINLTANITLSGGEISIPASTIVTINGEGHFISGANATRIFYLANTTSKLTIENLTLTNGNGVGVASGGGAVMNNGGTFTATNCSFIENEATSIGGAVYSSGTFTATNCLFVKNKAGGGGAVRQNSGTFTATNCSFIENETTNGGGGAVSNAGGTSNFENCSFTKNKTVNGNGGAVYNGNNVSITATNCSFTENTANNDGGAVSTTSTGSFTATNCSFYNNTASGYGGAVNVNSSSNIYLYHSTIVKNKASGGGVYVNYGGVLFAYNCIIAGNTKNNGTTLDQIYGTLATGSGSNLIEGEGVVTYSGVFGSNQFSYGYIRPLTGQTTPALTETNIGSNVPASTTAAEIISKLATDQIGQSRSSFPFAVTYGAVESAVSKVVVKLEIGNNGKVNDGTNDYAFSTTKSFAAGNITFTFIPDAGYRIKSGFPKMQKGTGTISTITSPHTLTLNDNYTISVEFELIPTYTLTINNSSGNGSFSYSVNGGVASSVSPATLKHGDNIVITFTPSSGYVIGSVTGGSSTLSGNTYTINNVTGNQTINVTFQKPTLSLNISGKGSVEVVVNGSPQTYTSNQVLTLNAGDNVSLTFIPNPDNIIRSVRINGGGSVVVPNYTISSVSSNQTINVSFGSELTEPQPGTILRIGGKIYVGPGTKVIIGPP